MFSLNNAIIGFLMVDLFHFRTEHLDSFPFKLCACMFYFIQVWFFFENYLLMPVIFSHRIKNEETSWFDIQLHWP